MEQVANALQRFDVVEKGRDRFVVFIDENDNLLCRRLPGRREDELLELTRNRAFFWDGDARLLEQVFDKFAQLFLDLLVIFASHVAHRETVHGRRLLPPFPRHFVDGKTLEEIAPSLEHRLQRGEHQ